jgi:response regulator RpfG family c-di-GMP phosphodiesterase
MIADDKLIGSSEDDPLSHISEVLNNTLIILTTSTPSVKAAINSMRCGVMAYMPKPLDNTELLEHVRKSVYLAQIQRVVRNSKKRLQRWHRDLTRISDLMIASYNETYSLPVDAFLTITVNNIVGSIFDIKNLAAGLSTNETQDACHMMNCPRLENVTSSLVTAIGILEKTKGSFKSRELGELRIQLEQLVNDLTLDNI